MRGYFNSFSKVFDGIHAMEILLNGENRALEAGLTLRALIVEIGLDERKVAVERNLEIVPRSTYGETLLQNGDRIEIVEFVGGG